MILSIFSTSDPSNLTNHILEFSKNVIKTSLILLMHFNIWIRLKVNINKDTTTTSVMLFWCFTYFEHNNFEHILHTLFYGFYHWLWTGSCPLDLASYSFRYKVIFSIFRKSIALLDWGNLSDYKFASLFTQHNGQWVSNPLLSDISSFFSFAYTLCILQSLN